MGKRYDVEHDIAYLLASGLRDKKVAQVSRRVIDWVFACPKGERTPRLMTVMMAFERAYLKAKSTEPTAKIVVQTMVDRMIAERNFGVVLDLELLRLDLRVVPEQLSFRQLAGIERVPEAQIHFRAFSWIACTLVEAIGSTLERSIQFAFFLMEEFARFTQTLDAIPREQRVHDAMRRRAGALSLFIFQSAVAPPHTLTPQKRWLLRLIEALESNAVAREAWQGIACILLSASDASEVRIIKVEEDSADARAIAENLAVIGMDKIMLQSPYLVLTPKHARIIRQFGDECTRIAHRDQTNGERVLAQFHQEQEQCNVHFHERCRAILERPRSWLRPSGFDHVDLAVTPLHNVGVRSIAFHPEGHEFPDVGVHFILKKETPHLIVLKRKLSRFELAFESELTLGNLHSDQLLLHKLLEYVVVDILYRIVVGEKTLRLKNTSSRMGNGTHVLTAKVVPVRPFIRRLPEGWHASEAATERARHTMGFGLPHGYTFVRSHDHLFVPATYQGGRIVHVLPTEPVAIYGDADLFENGGAA